MLQSPVAAPVAEFTPYTPPPRFYCLLEEQPDHLVPEHQLESRSRKSWTDVPLFLNYHSWFIFGMELPVELAGAPFAAESFALQPGMIWIQDPGTKMLQPFWPSAEVEEILAGLSPGSPLPTGIPERVKHVCTMADIFVPENYSSMRRRQWAETVSHCSSQFLQNGYTTVAGLIHPFYVAALRRYYRCMVRTKQLPLGDTQNAHRYVAHNEEVARFFHHQLTPAVSAIVGQAVKPSYVYLGAYQGDTALAKHVDRDQCEFSITFCLDYSPEPQRETSWSIDLHTPKGKVSVFQALGDALFYRGCEVPHSRDRLPQGHTSTSLFFHYVKQDFTGSLD